MNLPPWLRPTAVLAGAYVVLMGATVFFLGPAWHAWDWAVFQYVSNLHAPAFSSEIAVIDLHDYDERSPGRDRQTIARILDGLDAKHPPKAVLLDLFFEATCGPSDRQCRPDAATAALTKSLDNAAARGITVYATENPIGAQGAGVIDARFLNALDRENVYDHLAAGHTILQLAASDGLFYQRCYPLPQYDAAGNATGVLDLWALPYRAAKYPPPRARPQCERSGAAHTMEAVRLGAEGEFHQSVIEVTAQQPVPRSADLAGKFVIVATLDHDLGPLHTDTGGRSNPELLAWALSDLLDRGEDDAGYMQPIPVNDMLAWFVVGFTGITVVAFIAAFQGLRRLRLRALRPFLPWIAAGGAVFFALALFGAFEGWMLFTKQIQPQVSLVALSVLWAGGLCGERGREMLFEQLYTVDASAEDRAMQYDVFISYAHDEVAWVYENLFVPLRDARTPDGKKLEIFFDTASIRVGSSWQEKIADAIDGSRFVVPVYSETYFKRPYCKAEIRRAHLKWTTAPEGTRWVRPIMRGKPVILAMVDEIQAVSVEDQPGIVAEIVAEIVASAGPKAAPSATTAEPV